MTPSTRRVSVLKAGQATREAIVGACRDMTRLGINQGMSGNISVRHADAMLITPTATPYDLMTPEDIAEVPLTPGDLTWTGPKRPSSEWRIHRDILASRPDINAVVHAHPIHCTAIAMTRRGIPPCHYMVATFGGEDVRCAGYATFGTQALSQLVLDALADRTACLMANHGVVACGTTLDQALWRATELEALARQYLASLSAGTLRLLTAAEIREAEIQFQAYRP